MRIAILVFCCLFFAACEENLAPEPLSEEEIEIENKKRQEAKKNDVEGGALGNYVGDFVESKSNNSKGTYINKINIVLKSLDNGVVTGKSIIAGNDRPFAGKYTIKNDLIDIVANEPGDDKHDGIFYFTLDTINKVVKGKWVCSNKRVAVSERTYELPQRVFVYKANNQLPKAIIGESYYNSDQINKSTGEEEQETITEDALKINASTNEIRKEDIQNMYKGDLELIRNTIYARHGYSFRNRKMRYIFDNYVDWYMPMSADVRFELTALEKKNIELLKRYEEHAEKYYDVFGR
ncbi:MAG: YARHG domain-containing protein [Chitinophagaceae bacterium]